jgi:hypothetical protein
LLEFPRTAVAGVAGRGKDLRRGLAGIEVRLRLRRERCEREGCSNHPRQDLIDPWHGYPSVAAGFCAPATMICCEFLAKKGLTLLAALFPRIAAQSSCRRGRTLF